MRVVGGPVCEVVFGEDGKVGAGFGGGFYEGGGFVEVVVRVEGLVGRGGLAIEIGVEVRGWDYLGVELDQRDFVLWSH